MNNAFEIKYGHAKKIKGPPLDKDVARLMNFLADANSTEDEQFLAHLWLDKFNHWRDTVPQRDDTNKRALKPTDRYAPPDIPDNFILKRTRAPTLKASIPKVVDMTTATKSTSAATSVILPSQLGESTQSYQ